MSDNFDPFALGGLHNDAQSGLPTDEIIVDEDAKEALALLVGERVLAPLARELFEVEEELGNMQDGFGKGARATALGHRLNELLNAIKTCRTETVGGLAWHLREALAVVDFSEEVHPATEATLKAVFERAKALAAASPVREDVELIEAERALDKLASESAALLLIENPPEVDRDGYPVGWQDLRDQVRDIDEMIATMPPNTIAGAVVKLRRLLDPEVGMPTGDKDSDMPCLRQILATIERLVAGGAA